MIVKRVPLRHGAGRLLSTSGFDLGQKPTGQIDWHLGVEAELLADGGLELGGPDGAALVAELAVVGDGREIRVGQVDPGLEVL